MYYLNFRMILMCFAYNIPRSGVVAKTSSSRTSILLEAKIL